VRAREEMAVASETGSATHGHRPTPGQVAAAVAVLGMLADATRLELMWVLLGGERDVAGLTAAVSASRSSVSQHLGRLRLAGLVEGRREGRRMIYRAHGGHVRALVGEALFHADHDITGADLHD